MSKLNGANGKRTMIIVYPNTKETLRLVLVDDALAGELCQWLHRTHVPYQRTTTIMPGVKKSVDEQARIYKLLMDFRRDRGSVIDIGSLQ